MDDPREFGPITDRIGFQLRRLDVEWRSSLTDQLASYGVTPARATALVFVALHEGCDQMALGCALGINRASTMKVVNELVALGALERRLGRDRRTNALFLTQVGHDLRVTFEQITEDHDRAMLSALSADEVVELRRLLAKIQPATQTRTKPEEGARPPALRRIK